MKTLILACEMLRDELELAMANTGTDLPVVWLEKGLHEFPKRLKQALQEEIDRQSEQYDQILLGYSYCGGALDGITSRTAVLAVPRFDDCIRMILSQEPGQRNEADCRSLYFTRQWMLSDRHISKDYERDRKRYGDTKVARIYKSILANYRTIQLVDTGAYPMAPAEVEARATAELLALEFATCPGTIRILEKLLRQEFDAEICIKQPGEAYCPEDFLNF